MPLEMKLFQAAEAPDERQTPRVRMKIPASSSVSTTGTFPIYAPSLAGSEGQWWAASLSLGSCSLLQTL